MTTLDNGVVIEEQWDAVFFTPNAQVPSWGIGPRAYDFITIHWWGDTTDFMTVVNTFCNGNKQTSAHYIAESGRVACVVSPQDAAWACGNLDGNRRSISIECNPLGRDGDYETVASLIRFLRTMYGDLPLVPHNYWVATACPGNYDLNRLDQLARGANTFPTNIPNTTETDVAISVEDIFNKDFARQGSSLGGTTNLGAVVAWFDSNMEALQNLIKAVPTAPPASGPLAIDQNTIDTIAGRVADIFLQRGYILTQRTQA